MAKVSKIAISLPTEILEAVERERLASGESRSEFFRKAVEALLRQERQRTAIKQYMSGYQRIPESIEEVDAVHRAASAVLAEELWE